MVAKPKCKRGSFKIGLLIMFIAVLTFFLGSCGSKDESEKSRTEKIKDGNLELSISVPKGDFGVGKEIPITILVKNVGREIEFLHCNTEQRFDVEIKDSNDKLVWRWSQGKIFALVRAQIKLIPDDSEEYHATWPQKDAAGNQVPPGKYTLTAKSTADETGKTISISVKTVK